ncbi:2-oxoglutarate:acceptor oxidoreductase [candidate division LCP-89 bacterium B3_LCP]|uniref:2-oxoglutarate:acceptor oxidoreductase n=1 Tax=candidate division LCP-89 bacterium B3_LCP TaxID=2012998 RepID=A0A532V5T3_UNCL8|nr:MAG: 2-oxoglutarate:acceptor oxidoreductase [candidate division LCP-89 bacterium B3_LCP]
MSENILRYDSKKKDVVILIDRNLCKGCDICIKVCKPECLALVDAPDKWEGAVVDVVNADDCTFCKLCELQCPDFGIRILRKDEVGKIQFGDTKKTAAEQ